MSSRARDLRRGARRLRPGVIRQHRTREYRRVRRDKCRRAREHLSRALYRADRPKGPARSRPTSIRPETNFFCLRSFHRPPNRRDRRPALCLENLSDWSRAIGTPRMDGIRAGAEIHSDPAATRSSCREEGNCSYAEEFAAAIPESDLRQNPKRLSVTFTDHAGDAQTINISAEQIAAQLTALAEHQKPGRDAGIAPGSPHQP